jgi:DNA-binding PadR family transcriptional regulator
MEKAFAEDYLDEDRPMSNQQYAVISYILPGKNNEFTVPMFKIRGSYKTVEDCQKKIESLNNTDTYHHKYICSVGMWGGLFGEEELEKMDDIDVNYRNSQLNDMMKQYKENRDAADLQFEERKTEMKKRAEFELTEEGREMLRNVKESPVAVAERIKFFDKELEQTQKKLDEILQNKKDNEKLMEKYTPEELEELHEFNRKQNNPEASSSKDVPKTLAIEETIEPKQIPDVIEESIKKDVEEIKLNPANFNIDDFNAKFESLKNGSDMIGSDDVFTTFNYASVPRVKEDNVDL